MRQRLNPKKMPLYPDLTHGQNLSSTTNAKSRLLVEKEKYSYGYPDTGYILESQGWKFASPKTDIEHAGRMLRAGKTGSANERYKPTDFAD